MLTAFVPTADTGEPNDALASSASVGWNQTIAASILPIGDADFCRIRMAHQGELKISFTNAPDGLDMAFRVLDASGEEVRGWQASPETGKPYSVCVDIKVPGDYIVEVRDSYNNARSAKPCSLLIQP